jgi:transposase-like protein
LEFNHGKKALKQRYLCNSFKNTFTQVARTIFGYSNTFYHVWIDFIACAINGLTLKINGIAISKSKTKCFSMRHKLYDGEYNVALSGEIELDST